MLLFTSSIGNGTLLRQSHPGLMLIPTRISSQVLMCTEVCQHSSHERRTQVDPLPLYHDRKHQPYLISTLTCRSNYYHQKNAPYHNHNHHHLPNMIYHGPPCYRFKARIDLNNNNLRFLFSLLAPSQTFQQHGLYAAP